jgi:transposase
MVKDSPLGYKITRNMLQLSHSKFRERLLYYGKTKGINVYVVNEHYTTKICSHCGELKTMGGNNIYNCEACNTEITTELEIFV